MLEGHKRRTSWPWRVWQAVKQALTEKDIYRAGMGDPDRFEPLRFIRDRYVLPYVDAGRDAVEIGVGGGRWTRYLLGFRTLYAVDFHQQLLDELRKNPTGRT